MYSQHLGCYLYLVDPMTKVFKDASFTQGILSETIDISLAGNESEPAQLVIAAKTDADLHDIKIEFSDLVSNSGAVIESVNFKYNLVGYVPVRKNGANLPACEILRAAPGEFPDPLLNVSSFDIPKGELETVWLTFYAPAGTPAGQYTGSVSVVTDAGREDIPITARIWDFTIPAKPRVENVHWWMVEKLCEFHSVGPWTDEFFEIFATYARDMRDHRMNVIFIPIFARATFHGGQSVQITKKAGGGYAYDFSRVARMIDTAESVGGFDKYLLSHLIMRDEWEGRDFFWHVIQYFDEATGKTEELTRVHFDSPEFREIAAGYLSALDTFLGERGLLDKTYMHITDEPLAANLDVVIDIATFARRHAPRVKFLEAVRCEGLRDVLDVQCPQVDEWSDYYASHRAKGNEVYWYTCQIPQADYPNRFVNIALIKARILGWLTWKYDVSGHLDWAYNYWVGEPYKNVETNDFPPGDNNMVYPDGKGIVSSIRWEIIRKGWEDYEYLAELAELLGDRAKVSDMIERVAHTTNDFTRNTGLLLDCKRQIAEMIEACKRK